MLSFPINPDVISGNGSPVSGLKLYVYVWKREPKRKVKAPVPTQQASNLVSTRDLPERSRRRKQRRNKTIKIRVFMSDENGVKGKRIAELKKKINHSKFQPIPLPISLIKNIPHSPGNKAGSVHIRVECSRCSRKTRLILPGSNNKRCRKRRKSKARKAVGGRADKAKDVTGNNKDKAENGDNKEKMKARRRARRRRRRNNCAKTRSLENLTKGPFIVIMDDNFMSRSSRFKRSTINSPLICTTKSRNVTQPDTTSSSNSNNHVQNPTANFTTPNQQKCCQKLETYIHFSDLNLDTEILAPSGFSYSMCSTTCANGTNPGRDLHTIQQQNLVKISLGQKINSYLVSPSSPHHSSTDSIEIIKHSPSKLTNILKRSRLKEGATRYVLPSDSTPCSPSARTALTFLHFNKDSALVQTIIPDFIVTDCQCKDT